MPGCTRSPTSSSRIHSRRRILATIIGAPFFPAFHGAATAASRTDNLDLASLPRLKLAVNAVRVVPIYVEPARPPNVEHLAAEPPLRTLALWGRRNLRSVGGPGLADFRIASARIIQTRLGGKPNRLTDLFQKRPVARLDGVVDLRLELRDRSNGTRIVSSARSTGRRVLMSGYSNANRIRQVSELSRELVRAALAELVRQSRRHMVEYLR